MITEDYFRRIEAVEFAVKNDDGAEPRNLPKADLVLVGISRTSKTPLSTYLAQRGLKVANVPLVLGVDPPEELSQVDDRKVFGLIVQPDMLMRIRQARLSHLGMPQDSSYGQRAHIDNEIAYAREIFRKHANWPVIDVTNRAIEETAADILRIYTERNSTRRYAALALDGRAVIARRGTGVPGAPCSTSSLTPRTRSSVCPRERLAVPRRGHARAAA